MCILAWDWNPQAQTLLLIGNRDEWYARPTQGLHHWEDAPILAGRDLQAGGTWMGVAAGRRMAALTNVRCGLEAKPQAPSRGHLVQAFLQSSTGALDYLRHVLPRAAEFNPFNLLVWDGATLALLESRHARVLALSSGVGSLSNGDWGAPWPKTQRLAAAMAAAIAAGQGTDAQWQALLQDRWQAPDAGLPDTGVGPEWERLLAPIFVHSEHYGTRCRSVLRLDGRGARFGVCERDGAGVWAATERTMTWL